MFTGCLRGAIAAGLVLAVAACGLDAKYRHAVAVNTALTQEREELRAGIDELRAAYGQLGKEYGEMRAGLEALRREMAERERAVEAMVQEARQQAARAPEFMQTVETRFDQLEKQLRLMLVAQEQLRRKVDQYAAKVEAAERTTRTPRSSKAAKAASKSKRPAVRKAALPKLLDPPKPKAIEPQPNPVEMDSDNRQHPEPKDPRTDAPPPPPQLGRMMGGSPEDEAGRSEQPAGIETLKKKIDRAKEEEGHE
ncbi:MAG: hypothetical protein D6690_05165 [Nitrospirae bacterium]|nr:MAG: hypothetical protein D6690_05165 [Nitrospirota bacterium]